VTRKISSLLTFGFIIAALAVVVTWRITGDTRAGKHKRPDQPLVVEMAKARMQPMPISLQAVGQVQSEHSVQIRPQVSGMLEAVYFSEGQAVTKGQRLFRIDPAPYEAALGAARAAAKNAQANAARLAPLAGKEYVTSQEFDNARTAADQARAALTQAQINLAYTDIRAPIAGRTGSLAVKTGNLVASGDAAPLVVINQMQPILAQYTIPQQILPELQRYQAQHSIRIFITREDGSGDLGEGELIFIDNAVTTATGTVTLKARLPNAQEQLWPGQYVGVRTQLAVQADAIVVPQSAVQTGQSGNFVYSVEKGSAVVRPVHVDRQVDDLAIITSGLKAGETVVTRAPRNLRPGLKVIAADSPGKSSAQDLP
jgi:RND family efflux transporter MFP subunit